MRSSLNKQYNNVGVWQTGHDAFSTTSRVMQLSYNVERKHQLKTDTTSMAHR